MYLMYQALVILNLGQRTYSSVNGEGRSSKHAPIRKIPAHQPDEYVDPEWQVADLYTSSSTKFQRESLLRLQLLRFRMGKNSERLLMAGFWIPNSEATSKH
jgi:hypothetical protein